MQIHNIDNIDKLKRRFFNLSFPSPNNNKKFILINKNQNHHLFNKVFLNTIDFIPPKGNYFIEINTNNSYLQKRNQIIKNLIALHLSKMFKNINFNETNLEKKKAILNKIVSSNPLLQ